MKRSTWKKRALASALALTMAASVLPMAGFAAEGTSPLAGETGTEGLKMNKTATLEDDGTYTINLEAWATGETTTVTTTEPLDIVLVLDVSGSMKNEMDGDATYTKLTGNVSGAYDNYRRQTYHLCEDGTYGKVAWEKNYRYGSYSYSCEHCEANQSSLSGRDDIESSWNLYRITTTKIQKMDALKTAVNGFIDGVAEKNAALTNPADQHRVSLVKFGGDKSDKEGNHTYTSGRNTYNYTQIVKNLTTVNATTANDLKTAVNSLIAAGSTPVDYAMDKAKEALQSSGQGRNKVVILFGDGEPNYFSGFDYSVASYAIDKAKELKNQSVTIYSIAVHADADPTQDPTDRDTARINKFFHAVSSNYLNASLAYSQHSGWTWNMGNRNEGDYYKTAANAGELNDIFQEIEDDVSTTDVTLDANAVLKDIVADQFTLPANAEVTAETVKCTGKSGDTYIWEEHGNALSDENITQNGNTVSVTGFNYKEQFVHEEDGEWTGSKLVVTIKGVEALDAAATGTEINTNALGSGIYENAEKTTPVAEFVSPKTLVNKELYVLDYAKEATLTGMPNTTTHLDGNGMHCFAAPNLSLNEEYGTVNKNTYTPTTMNWDGYDQYYVFGHWNNEVIPDGVTTGVNAWTKVAVMPANNVYYEDDFITTKDGSTVGIEYTGDWKEVSDNAEDCGNNTETPNNGVHGGWQNNDLANDTGYSDGSAHAIKEKMARATFTFTGTGVDVYGRTNENTGLVVADLYKVNDDDTAVLSKTLVVNTSSESGDYYQIPTLFFSGLDYGTYKVVLTVATQSEDQFTFYLDGIRVYNPIQGNDIVDDAYGNEAHAVFQSVRDILLDKTNAPEGATELNGAVFIDKNADGNTGTETSEIGTYEDYGPKNEVYLAKGQSIAFKLADFKPGTAYIGLKVPTREETTVLMTKGEAKTDPVTVAHSTDLYYEITPNDEGMFYIENTGDNLLSITKLRTTDGTTVGEASVEALLSYANTMDTLPEVPYGDEGSNGSEDGGNVDIENPDQGQETPGQGNSFLDILKDIFESIRNWF